MAVGPASNPKFSDITQADMHRQQKKQERQAKIRHALSRFGFTTLRGLQGPALRSVLKQKDTVVLMPTGGGKSLCYQLPALLLSGLVVVLCPLLALMQNQVHALRKKQIRVEMLSSLVSEKERANIHQQLREQFLQQQSKGTIEDRIELIYTTPETLMTDKMQQLLHELNKCNAMALFAIDEAHCISAWGHDFRPAYRQLGNLRQQFPQVPFIALTATATEQVRRDIHQQLHLATDANVLQADFNRENITYTVINKEPLTDPLGALYRYIHKYQNGTCGIIYVHKRSDTDDLVAALQEKDPKLSIAAFHAKIPQQQREQVLRQWLIGEVKIICATIAFGMGIDHPHVRFVVHWNVPKSLENFYQESGRAGRDGAPSQSIMMYSSRDYELFRFLIEKARQQDTKDEDAATKRSKQKRNQQALRSHALELLSYVKTFATKRECRRQAILRYFGQKIAVVDCKGACDVCNPRLNFFRFEQTGIVDEAIERVCRQTIRSIEQRTPFSDKQQRTRDLRHKNLIYDYNRGYVPEETRSIVVRRDNRHSLAADGFVAVNGEDDGSNDDNYRAQDEEDAILCSFSARTWQQSQNKRGQDQSETLNDTLEMLERAERIASQIGTRTDGKSKRSRHF